VDCFSEGASWRGGMRGGIRPKRMTGWFFIPSRIIEVTMLPQYVSSSGFHEVKTVSRTLLQQRRHLLYGKAHIEAKLNNGYHLVLLFVVVFFDAANNLSGYSFAFTGYPLHIFWTNAYSFHKSKVLVVGLFSCFLFFQD
jgi:hypothetical protein